MPVFKLTIKRERDIECFIEADSKEEVQNFLDDNAEWQPDDVEGLIDRVTDEEEVGYVIEEEPTITSGFELVGGKLMEKQ